jgi:serine/threonine-protein kinase RsbT
MISRLQAVTEVVARSGVPGIPDIARMTQDSFSTSDGLGLPGLSRLIDEFEITSEAGWGTVVSARKWKI